MKLDIVVVSSLILAAALGSELIAAKRLNKTGTGGLVVLGFSVMLWSLIYLGWGAEVFPATSKPAAILVYIARLCAASSLLAYALSTTGRPTRISYFLFLLGFIPLIIQVFWIHPQQTLGAFSVPGELHSAISIGEVEERLGIIYVFTLSTISAFFLWETATHAPWSYRPHILATPSVATLIILAQTLDYLEIRTSLSIELTLFSLVIATAVFAFNLTRDGLTEIVFISRHHVVDAMVDGLMVLDRNNIVIDMNAALESIIGQPRKSMIGKPVDLVAGKLPNLDRPITDTFEIERKRYLRSPDEWQYLIIRVSPLMNQNKEVIGRLIAWRDATNRHRADDARQKAREEMFVLINAISSEAREAASLQEFLSETIYQIVYPFRSQAVMIFLVDESEHEEKEPRYYLASHFGIPNTSTNDLQNISSSSSLFSPALTDRLAVIVENASQDPRVPPELQQIGMACFLVIPLITQVGGEGRVLGCMFLGRKDKPVYGSDEFARITAVCDHIANLIDNDRRRKLAIALSERQRILRDLHDSVSQKLYGLVTLTEVAQAALETGNFIDPAQVLSRIGENARQAVKEMRLFLYQIQPVDLEKEGLISALHHRLAAVEGRADIKARLLADENIELSKEKEISLFFIAQEALNNILRHARAKTVTVKLKQGRKNVTLEIVDDGCGFDPKKMDRAGLGLENMKERTMKVNGKLKITSAPGAGTKIVVSVQRDQIITPKKKKISS